MSIQAFKVFNFFRNPPQTENKKEAKIII